MSRITFGGIAMTGYFADTQGEPVDTFVTITPAN